MPAISEEGTFSVRLARVLSMMDIRTAFASDDSIRRAITLTKQFSAAHPGHQGLGVVVPDEVQTARKLVEATCHPDTGDIIRPAALRISCCIPMNLCMDTCLIMARGVPLTIGAQWLNQTYNALHYYANRNASNEDTSAQRWIAYTTATASSVAAAIGVNRWGENLAKRAAASDAWKTQGRYKQFMMRSGPTLARAFAPLVAVAAADVLNLFTMRCSEWMKGVNVYQVGSLTREDKPESLGTSRRAGLLAVSMCTASRVIVCAPILLIPAYAMHRLEKRAFFASRPWARIPTLMGFLTVILTVCAPVMFAMFKQTASVDVKWLEPELRNLKDAQGNPIRIVEYNKGL